MKSIGIFACAALFVATPAFAQAAAEDESTRQMINNADPSTFNVYGVDPKPKSVKDESVQGGRAMKVKVPGGGNVWDVGVSVPITKAIKKGDPIEMMFFARFEKGAEGQTTAQLNGGIQLAAAPYSSFMTKTFDVTPEWTLYKLTGTADKDYAVGSINASFQLNTGKHTTALGVVAVFDKNK